MDDINLKYILSVPSKLLVTRKFVVIWSVRQTWHGQIKYSRHAQFEDEGVVKMHIDISGCICPE